MSNENEQYILECIKSNPKNLSFDAQKALAIVMTDFATELFASKLDNREIEKIWSFVRKIFKNYGIE